ncbi:MAG TPA: methyltransferase domain-containing protein [Chromatiaceae bacterium]|nr:methyltransferase domain-containing protein [Chromatiaceae bacterium]
MTEEVKFYYGKVLRGSDDLKTDACCTTEDLPAHIKTLMKDIHPEVASRYYGCGLVVPELLEDCRVLDLGSGSGQDVFLLAGIVGEQGEVVGVDMTPEQLEVARRYETWHQEKYGYARPNTRFLEGRLEHLDELPLEPGAFDIVISNCVLNLVPDKEAVLKGVFRLLKPGGEFYFSDVYADRRLPEALKNDPILYGECLSGALYWNDFQQMAKAAGFADPRLVTDRPLTIDDPAQQGKLGNARFYSATYRLIKLEGLEAYCEDYGQAVRYKGSIPHHEHNFALDKHHVIETGRMFPVCGNTWRMLHDTRFAPHFEFFGDFSTHYGIFADCGTTLPFDDDRTESANSGCC